MKSKSLLATSALGLTLLLGMGSAANATSEGWTTDFAAAKKLAAEGKKSIFMNFTGSDW